VFRPPLGASGGSREPGSPLRAWPRTRRIRSPCPSPSSTSRRPMSGRSEARAGLTPLVPPATDGTPAHRYTPLPHPISGSLLLLAQPKTPPYLAFSSTEGVWIAYPFRAGGGGRLDGRLLRERLPRSRAPDGPGRGEAAAPRTRGDARAGGAGASWSATPPCRSWPRRPPHAYKDLEQVVEVVERAGQARRVAFLAVMGVVKG